MQNSGQDHYHFVNNNSGRPTNVNWDSGGRHDQGQNHKNFIHRDRIENETFTKFRDASKDQQRQIVRHRGDSGGGDAGGGRRSGGRGGGGGVQDRGRIRRRGGGGHRGRGDQRNGFTRESPWYKDPLPSDIFYFTNGKMLQEETAEHKHTHAPVAMPSVPVAPMSERLQLPVAHVSEAPIKISSTVLNATNIKKEKGDSLPKQPANETDSSSDSSSSSSDESYEADKRFKATPGKTAEAAVPQNTKTRPQIASKPAGKPAVSSSSSSSSEDDSSSDDDNLLPSKNKAAGNGLKMKSNLSKPNSEEDVVCMGVENRQFTIPDESDNDEEVATANESETTPKQKSTKGKNQPQICGICDKKGHTSFECQMICRNCSAPHHSLKNCPNPPNLNIALQAFMEFTMQQLTVFNMDKRFNFPAGVVTAPSALIVEPQTHVAAKSKKEKRSLKKSKKKPKKKVKIEVRDSDDDEEDQTSTSESESSESSADKVKRKRNLKQANNQPAPNMTTAAAYPFPYNSFMYPYGAAFNFPK